MHSSNNIFGEAYVKAVNLEKETNFPRIEFDLSVFSEDFTPIMDEATKSICVKGVDDQLFLNSLGWHQGVWKDYFHFKYGESEWPNEEKLEDEMVDEINRIESIIDSQKSTLIGSALEKWKWFYRQWYSEKNQWPIFD